MIDEDTAREKYFGDPSPEKTAARILGDATLKHPLVQLPLVYRSAVRTGLLMPELAVAALAKDLGIDPSLAFLQLQQHGAFTPEQAAQVEQLLLLRQQQQELAQAQQAAGMAPQGMEGPAPPGGPGGGAQGGAPPPAPPGGGQPGGGTQPIPGISQPALPEGPGLPEVAPPPSGGPRGGAGGNPPGVPSPGGGLAQLQQAPESLAARAVRM
jgi:hypothetical protein